MHKENEIKKNREKWWEIDELSIQIDLNQSKGKENWSQTTDKWLLYKDKLITFLVEFFYVLINSFYNIIFNRIRIDF